MVFEFTDASGKVQSFTGQANYYAPDEGWAFHDYPIAMLDPFARGQRLTLRNGDGVVVATFGLKGSAKARAAMEEACGF